MMNMLPALIPIVVSLIIVPISIVSGLRIAATLRRLKLDDADRSKALPGFLVGLGSGIGFGVACAFIPPFSSFFGILAWTLVISAVAMYLPPIITLLGG